MNTTHTPGPWKVTAGKFDESKHILSIGTETEFIAVMESVSVNSAPYKLPKNAEANARLIAAAPELLAALDYLQSMPNDPRAHRQAFDAMKKARGTEAGA